MSEVPENLEFNSIDVETANADRASICQIGIVHVQDGKVVDRWSTLVNPQAWFDPMNISIHGITEATVRDSPTIANVQDELHKRISNSILVCHTPFDRVALQRAMDPVAYARLQVTWLDSARVVRRAWPERYRLRGYGLRDVAWDLGISFRHHDALEDARAAAEIILHACAATEYTLEEWVKRTNQRITPRGPRTQPDLRRDGNEDGPLYGETVVFTGALEVPRKEAADMAAEAGCHVATQVSGKVTMLVVGAQNRNVLKGYDKSSKHRKAAALIEEGANIQVLSESDFVALVRT